MAFFRRQFVLAIATGGLTLLLLPAMQMRAQSFSGRLSRPPAQPEQQAPAPQPAASAQPAAAPRPQSPAPASQTPPSMLQQPAQEAKILFTGNSLSIHADNSSLMAILSQFAAKSGMRIDGLNGDERVFGSFGPGAPRDVLADLLNGTAYNVVMVGDLSNGAPRELILSPSTQSGGAPIPSAPPQSTPEEASTDQESTEVTPPAAEQPPPTNTPPATPGVKTPQQLFEQLQRMRQAQQQQANPQPDQTQQPAQQPPQ